VRATTFEAGGERHDCETERQPRGASIFARLAADLILTFAPGQLYKALDG